MSAASPSSGNLHFSKAGKQVISGGDSHARKEIRFNCPGDRDYMSGIDRKYLLTAEGHDTQGTVWIQCWR
jgi:hypothetical protein